ncbi:nucleoside triphosphate pyrophosphohydrolase [Holdemania massiliensis]|uniref:nucleoside triphosphate pyrophosphohydrolase n=1 Tax=Holdemania massiliensis TaxID=1468449 RepID=UPI001F063C34|nr:nucleoside triphosphate pyrophosphohydrolase [Holdemania massiliensis]MCH1941540.1 nucleoside triphosphate pyrophosphohydrolase [Holdemania massiliensis]
MQIHHNKLVRDRIPDIIRAEHRHCQTRTLTSSAYCTALKAKLVEMEVQNAEDRKALTEELADLSEVVDAVIRHFALNEDEIQTVKKQKANSRGRFEDRIFLEYVESDEGESNQL